MKYKTIEIQPDEPAIIATRLAERLRREGIICSGENGIRATNGEFAQVVEALADELHRDIIDRMLRSSRAI